MTTWPDGWHRDGDGAKGPCPLCSTLGRRAWARHYPNGWRAGCSGGCRGRAILAALGLDAGKSGVWRPSDHARRLASLVAPSPGSVMASVLWARSNPPDLPWDAAADHARAVQIADCYLRGRGLAWPAERPRPWRVLPESWLRQVELEYDGGRAICRRPEWTAAVVMWPFLSAPCADRPPEGLTLQLEALASDGRRVLISGAKRYTLGPTSGRAFHISAAAGRRGLAVCEGPTTALAVAAAYPTVDVLAVGGQVSVATMRHWRAWLRRGEPVRLFGEAGQRADVMRATRALRALGYDVRDPWTPGPDAPLGTDFEDWRQRWTIRRCSRR